MYLYTDNLSSVHTNKTFLLETPVSDTFAGLDFAALEASVA